MDSGLYREYIVKTINYNIGGTTDSATFYYREEQVDWELDTSGDTILTINRYIRYPSGQDWKIDSVFSVKKNNRTLILNESNVPYVKLVFPVHDQIEWNGNAYNSLTEEKYHYADVSKESNILDSIYLNTITVIQKEFIDTIVYTIIKKEFYASGMGLIYKESINLNYCTENDDCIGKKIITYGNESRQWIISYGHN